MARRPTKLKKERPILTPEQVAYLSDDTDAGFEGAARYTLGCYRMGHRGLPWNAFPGELWEANRDFFLPEFIKENPGKRPLPWWQWDAPSESRRRLGGIGTPKFEVLAYAAHFFKGIPESWVDQWDVDYYNGRKKDTHGNLIPTKYKDGDFGGQAIDPNDPPVYEPEAEYLRRHGLLTPEEVKVLASMPEAWEPEKVEFDGDF